MKNLKNLLPIFVFVLGFAIVFTQSAFKPSNKTNKLWGIVYDEHEDIESYVDLSSYTFEQPENPLGSLKYTCDADANLYCTALFDVSITPNSSTPNPENGDLGIMRKNP